MFTFFWTEDLSKKMYYTHHCSFPMIEMLKGEIDSSFSNHQKKNPDTASIGNLADMDLFRSSPRLNVKLLCPSVTVAGIQRVLQSNWQRWLR